MSKKYRNGVIGNGENRRNGNQWQSRNEGGISVRKRRIKHRRKKYSKLAKERNGENGSLSQ
jgi:hypothetical protein